MLVNKEHCNSACAGQRLQQEEILNNWFKRWALITRNIWGFCPLIAEHTQQNPATINGSNVTLKIPPLPFKLGSNLSSCALKYCRWSSQLFLLFCRNTFLLGHMCHHPAPRSYIQSHHIPHSSWVLLEQPLCSLRAPHCCSLQEMLLLGLFWVSICQPGLVLSIQDSSSPLSGQTVLLPAHPNQPSPSCVLCAVPAGLGHNPAASTEVKKYTHKVIFESSGSRAGADSGEVGCVALVANSLSAALAREMCDGDQLLPTAWLSGWELEI